MHTIFVSHFVRGNFATVKLGIHKKTGEKVAIKIIDKKKFALNPSLRKDQLLDEVRVMKSLIHPNILEIKDIFESDDYMYLVLELYAFFIMKLIIQCNRG